MEDEKVEEKTVRDVYSHMSALWGRIRLRKRKEDGVG